MPADHAARRPYRQVARARAQQRTREALLDAATEEFYEGRWEEVSLEALAGRAGVTKQTLLRHFGSKDKLLQESLVRIGVQVIDERWSAPPGDVQGIVENLVDHYEAWGVRALRLGSWQGGPPFLSTISRAARQLHYEWIDYAFAPQLERLEDKSRVRCRASLIALCDVQSWWIFSNDLGLDSAEVKATLVRAIERVLEDQS